MKTLEELKAELNSNELVNQIAEQAKITKKLAGEYIQVMKDQIQEAESLYEGDSEDIVDFFWNELTEDLPYYIKEELGFSGSQTKICRICGVIDDILF